MGSAVFSSYNINWHLQETTRVEFPMFDLQKEQKGVSPDVMNVQPPLLRASSPRYRTRKIQGDTYGRIQTICNKGGDTKPAIERGEKTNMVDEEDGDGDLSNSKEGGTGGDFGAFGV